MNLKASHWTLIAAVLGTVLVAGCSSNNSKTETPAASSEGTSSTPAPSAGGEQGESTVAVTPAGTVTEIWTQIEGEQGKLSAAIQSGQLKDVHHLAFDIRDLVVALVDKASGASPDAAAKLKGMVDQVKASATKLDELGDAGNVSGTQAEYAKLTTVLSAIKVAASAK